MKNNLIAVALVLGLSLSSVRAQSDSKVPQVIKTAFADKYSAAKAVKWDKEDKSWEVSFTMNGETRSVVFDAGGKQIESELEIPVVKLPETVRSYMKSQKKTIKAAAEITDAAGKVYYEAEAGGKDYLFNAAGKPVKKIGG